ncbi:MAG TPA: EpsI family protein [Pyrinomonadaceae bacterium]|nr:EpsI family protein [Pyrinomonadaceae bacterium]
MKASTRFVILLILLLMGGIVVNAWHSLGETTVARKNLDAFPRQIGSWEQIGGDQRFDNETLNLLRASDYLMRNYRTPGGAVANFYIGYYASQRDGATYHSPLNCLPGAGWVMTNPGKVMISPEGRNSFLANRYLIENGDHKELLIYWYQGRGRAVASEYWGKIYTVLDSVRLRRSDGAMIRVTVPVRKSEADALRTAVDLSATAATVLPEFVPD